MTVRGAFHAVGVLRRPLLRRVRAAYLISFAVVTIIGLAFGAAGERFVPIAAGLLGIAAIWFGILAFHPARAGAWMLLSVAVVLVGAGEASLGLTRTFGDRYGSPVDTLFVAGYLPLAVSALWIGHPPSPRQHWAAILDTAVISLAVTLIAWITLIKPTVDRHHLTMPGRDLISLDWVGDIALIAIGTLLILTWRSNRAAVLLGAAIAVLLATDIWQSVELLHGFTRGTTADYGFLLFCALAGLAAMDPSMANITSSTDTTEHLGVWRLVVLAVGLLVPPAILLAEATPGPVSTSTAIAVVGASIGLLMLARIAIGIRALRERTNNERALLIAASDLGSAQRADDVVISITAAARAMLGEQRTVVSLHPPDPALTSIRRVLEPDGITGFVRLPISAVSLDHANVTQTIGELRVAGPAQRLFGATESLTGLADQAAAALARISLADAVRSHERESYFRTLVQNSSDVILICKDNVVVYATPSAHQLFARPSVVGARVNDLVRFAEPLPDEASSSGEAAVDRPDGVRRVRVNRRDLTADDSVRGVVFTLHDVTVERQLTDELTYRANHDSLTGLPNGQSMRDELRTVGQQPPAGLSCAALFIDLDNFKEVNDTLGHAAGDDLLKVAAERIVGCLRRDTDIAARLGGDEFAVLLRYLHTVAAARDVADRVVAAFRRPIHLQNVSVNCTVSIGLAEATTRDEYQSLLRRADSALYRAKAAGKDTWQEYRPDLPVSVHSEPASGLGLGDAIRLNYQPIVDLRTGRTVGFEALTRLHDSSTTPADFIADAERSGLIVAVGDWVLDQALRDMPTLAPAGDRYVSVNISPIQLRHGGVAERILEQLAATNVPPGQLMLELTERLPLDDDAGAWDELALLHDSGIRIALDDYGTGYSSLSYLRHRSIDVIKLDRSFMRAPDEPRHRALLDVVARLSHRVGAVVIAEGIENKPERDAAAAAGFEYGQGLYFGAAMPPEAAAARSEHTGDPHV